MLPLRAPLPVAELRAAPPLTVLLPEGLLREGLPGEDLPVEDLPVEDVARAGLPALEEGALPARALGAAVEFLTARLVLAGRSSVAIRLSLRPSAVFSV